MLQRNSDHYFPLNSPSNASLSPARSAVTHEPKMARRSWPFPAVAALRLTEPTPCPVQETAMAGPPASSFIT